MEQPSETLCGFSTAVFQLSVSKLVLQFSNLKLVLFQKFICKFLFGTWRLSTYKMEAISIQAGKSFSDPS